MAITEQATSVLTVADVMQLEALAGAQVVAGHVGLGASVTGVNIVEVPDVWQWLQGGEFLLSSAYAWRDHPEEIATVLPKLKQCNVSAIAFKLGRHVEALPDRVLAAADALGFPTIVLPRTLPYRDVFEPLYARLLAHPSAAPEPVREMDQQWVRYGLDDQSIDKLAGGLADELQRVVKVIDELDDVVYTARPGAVAVREPLDQADDGMRILLDDLGRWPLHRQVSRVQHAEGEAFVEALVVGRRRYGYVAVIGPTEQHEARVKQKLAHAAELVSFLLLKRLAFLEGRREASGLFLGSLVSDLLSNEEATERALSFGLRLSRPLVFALYGFTDVSNTLSTPEWDVLHHCAEQLLEGVPHVVRVNADAGTLEVLLQAEPDEPAPRLASILDALPRRLPSGHSTPCCAVGSPRVGLEGVRQSRSEAQLAMGTACRSGQGGVVLFSDLGVERLLSQIPAGPTTLAYVESMLGPIEDNQTLLETLDAYLSHGANKSATASALHLHRSSLLYRLRKLSRMLEINLDDPDKCQELWLALRLRRVLQGSASLPSA